MFQKYLPKDIMNTIDKLCEEIKSLWMVQYKQESALLVNLTKEFFDKHPKIILSIELLFILMHHQILHLQTWQKMLGEYCSKDENVNEDEVIDFVELLIVTFVLDQKSVKVDDIPDIVYSIEKNSKNARGPKAVAWLGIHKLLDSDPTEIVDLHFQQYIKASQAPKFHETFTNKISVIYREPQHMNNFVRNALEKSLIAYDKFWGTGNEYVLLDKFASMVLACSYNWASHPNLMIAGIADVEVIILDLLSKYHDSDLTEFDQRPFRRIFGKILDRFSVIFDKSTIKSNEIEKLKRRSEVLWVLADVFKSMSPLRYPAFAFSWLELVTSPRFMPHMLSNNIPEWNTEQSWPKMQELFYELFMFLKQNIYENSSESPGLEMFYEGTMKTVAVVLHDFPEFFVYYYFQLINTLPLYKTGNLRNMILAAFPKSYRMPDPKHEIKHIDDTCKLSSLDYDALLETWVSKEKYTNYKNDLDEYVRTGEGKCMDRICKFLEYTQVIKDERRIIDTGVVHATMLYLAKDIKERNTIQELEDPAIAVKYRDMCQRLSMPVRDILISAMYNELRLLSKETVYFMNVLMHLSKDTDKNQDMTCSQIARILLERCNSQNVFPWGLLAFKHRFNAQLYTI